MLIQCRWVFLRIEIRERVGGKMGASQSRSISIHPSTSLRKLRFAQGTRPALICSLAPQDDPEGFGQDIYIQPEGPVADVALVQGDALFVGGVVADGDLPEAGDVCGTLINLQISLRCVDQVLLHRFSSSTMTPLHPNSE